MKRTTRGENPRETESALPRGLDRIFTAIRDHLSSRTKCLWLATATPMQLDWIEVFDLLYLAGRVAHFQQDPMLTWAYYSALGKLVKSACS